MKNSAVSIRERIAYALGDAAAGGITWKIMSIAFPLFFTNVFGLTFADAAALMLIARLFDVVTDPIMGSLADRTQSKWGTYRPWLIFGAIPFGLIFALLLYTPDFGPAGKRVYAYVLYLLMMAVYTAVNVWWEPTQWVSSHFFHSLICRRWWAVPMPISTPCWVPCSVS